MDQLEIIRNYLDVSVCWHLVVDKLDERQMANVALGMIRGIRALHEQRVCSACCLCKKYSFATLSVLSARSFSRAPRKNLSLDMIQGRM